MLNTLRVVNCCNGLCLILVAIVCFLIPVATVCVGTRRDKSGRGVSPPRTALFLTTRYLHSHTVPAAPPRSTP